MPGWSDRARRLRWWRDQFAAAGWPDSHIGLVDFADRFGGNEAHAAEIAGAVTELLARTGAAAVDVVAHSMGGLAVRHYLHFCEGARHVRRVVFTATPHAGTWAAYLAWGPGAADMRPGSSFLRHLAERTGVPPGIATLCIHTPTELRVLPWRSARLAGSTCRRVWSTSHAGMLRSRRVFETIRQFLSE